MNLSLIVVSPYKLAIYAALASVVVTGCGGSAQPGPNTNQSFIAVGASFQGWRSWRKFTLANSNDNLDGLVHTAGPRVVYLNQSPPTGSHNFPLGTLMVKEMLDPTLSLVQAKIFAMGKRGAGFNAQGAVGWEWFEIQNNGTDQNVLLQWRGVAPPAGETYGSGVTGGCNPCHMGASENDYVESSDLLLSNF